MRGLRRVVAACLAMLIVAVLGACGTATADDRTVLKVWAWEPSMQALAASFERENPDIRIELTSATDYDKLNSAIQDGYGTPDVVQLEYYALQQYAVSGQLVDITDRTRGYDSSFTPGTWSSVQLDHEVYAMPMDSGPMAFFYNKAVFDDAGIDVSKIRTWDDYYQAALRLKRNGVAITADAGDSSFYNAMIWLAGGRPYTTSTDGKTLDIDVTGDQGAQEFTQFWQRMIDEDLINTRLKAWSGSWKEALNTGSVASVFAGAWMPSLLMSDLPGSSGQWRVATMPTLDGAATNAENGGSALAILSSSRKHDAAFRFIDYVCHTTAGIQQRVDGGAFPADTATLGSSAFLDKTTVRDSRGIDVPYFGGQRFNRVLAQAAEDVSVGYQYLPFEVYARSDFDHTVGKAYAWSNSFRTFVTAESEHLAGSKNPDGSEITVPAHPGSKVYLSDGLALWQRDLREYAINQGFTLER